MRSTRPKFTMSVGSAGSTGNASTSRCSWKSSSTASRSAPGTNASVTPGSPSSSERSSAARPDGLTSAPRPSCALSLTAGNSGAYDPHRLRRADTPNAHLDHVADLTVQRPEGARAERDLISANGCSSFEERRRDVALQRAERDPIDAPALDLECSAEARTADGQGGNPWVIPQRFDCLVAHSWILRPRGPTSHRRGKACRAGGRDWHRRSAPP